jgi:drug/metabolite transporter (DMT)-like permease
MQQELLIAILAGLGGMFGWGFADFFAKKTIDQIGSMVSLVWAHLFGTIVLSLIALYVVLFTGRSLVIPTNPTTWMLLIFFGTLQAIVYLLAYKGFEKGKLAILNPLFASYSGLAALISLLFLGEKINLLLLLALVVLFTGVVLLNLDTTALRSRRIKLLGSPGVKEITFATILAAVWTLSWDKFVGGQEWLSFALWMYAFMTLAAFFISRLQRVNLSVKRQFPWKFLILIGLCEIIAYLAISLGFSTTSLTSIVAVIS